MYIQNNFDVQHLYIYAYETILPDNNHWTILEDPNQEITKEERITQIIFIPIRVML